MKKLIAMLLALVMVMSLAACGAKTEAPAATEAAPAVTEAVAEAVEEVATNDNWKVAIMTGTVSQGEEEFRAAEKAIATWGADHIITATYPDNFMSEMETTVSTLVGFASDPDVKAIVMCQAVPGCSRRKGCFRQDP